MHRLLFGGATLAACMGSPALGAAQQLPVTELSAGVAGAFARKAFLGGELGLAFRPRSQTRVAFAVAGGTIESRPAVRGQLSAQFLVSPAARRGVGPYAGLGIAVSARRDSHTAEFLALILGLEGRPGQARGWQNWYVELGFGGGARVAAGWRLRWLRKGR